MPVESVIRSSSTVDFDLDMFVPVGDQRDSRSGPDVAILTSCSREPHASLDDCWQWPLARKPHVRHRKGNEFVYRIVYEMVMGVSIPPEMVAHHTCLNMWCINPRHIEIVTEVEHGEIHARLRGFSAAGDWQRSKARCKQGHEFTPENTIVGRNGRRRTCLKCARASYRKYNAKRKSKRAQIF